MGEILLFTPKAELDAAANLRGFIEMCRTSLTVFGATLPFQCDIWDVTEAVLSKGRGNKRERITFSNSATVDAKSIVMMQEPFLSFAKAYVRYMHGMRPTKSIHNRMAAMRSIEAALSENGAIPDPVHVDSRILNRAAQMVADRFSTGAGYRVGQQLEIAGAFMADNRLTAVPVRWRNPIKRPNSTHRVGKEFDQRREAKLPSPAALDALPRIFHLATEAVDVITSSVAAILLSAPDRISEVLTLPAACEVREPRKDKTEAYGLRWWPAKGAKPTIKWLVPSMASVVQEALRKIRIITEEARLIAKWYEENPRQIYLPPDVAYLRDREWLSMEELAQILGLSNHMSANAWCRDKARKLNPEKRDGGGNRVFVRFSDVETKILELLPHNFPVIDQTTGLKYSEALLVIRKNELAAQRATYRCMIEAVSVGHINMRLGSRTGNGNDSIFSCFGFTEPDGSRIAITTHQFRHYLNTLAQAGDLSQVDIAKWSGRRDVGQNEAYNHVTPSQMLEKIRAAVGGDEMFGPIAEISKKVMIRRHEFARLVIPTAHTTDLGYCVHDYTASPCQLHLDCIHCEDLVCVKGDVGRAETLRQRLDEAQELLRKAEAAVGDGYSGSDRWTEHHRLTVERLSQLSKIMDDPTVPDGAVIQLAPPKTTFQTGHGAGELLLQPASEQETLPAEIKALIGG